MIKWFIEEDIYDVANGVEFEELVNEISNNPKITLSDDIFFFITDDESDLPLKGIHTNDFNSYAQYAFSNLDDEYYQTAIDLVGDCFMEGYEKDFRLNPSATIKTIQMDLVEIINNANEFFEKKQIKLT